MIVGLFYSILGIYAEFGRTSREIAKLHTGISAGYCSAITVAVSGQIT
jgi:hypothetical protein